MELAAVNSDNPMGGPTDAASHRGSGRLAEIVAAMAFYALINFNAPHARLLQPILWLASIVVLLLNVRTRALTIVHTAVILWLLSSAFLFARSSATGPIGIRLSAALLVPIAAVATLGPIRAVRAFTAALWLVVVVSVILAFVRPSTAIMAGGEWRGMFPHKNAFGFSCSMLTVICLAELVEARGAHRRHQLAAVGLIASAFGLVMARSATAIGVALLCAGITVAFSSKHRPGASPARTGLALCMAASPVILLAVASDQAFKLLGRDGTLTGRSDIWRLVLNVRSSSPDRLIGRGLDFWSPDNPDALSIWRAVRWTPFSSHNSYLDWWLMLGTIGAVILLLWMTFVLARCWRVSLRDPVLLCLFPLALCASISAFSEQYLISTIGLVTLGLASAASAASLAVNRSAR